MSETVNNLVGMDTETFLIGQEAPFPRPVCVQFSDFDKGQVDPGTVSVLDGMESIFEITADSGENNIVTVWHNASYDLQVMCQHRPDLLPKMIEMVRSGHAKCTLIREQMLNLAQYGHPSMIEINGVFKQISNALVECVRRYFGVDLSASKADDSWRMNYASLINVPLAQWPPEAVEYAADDPVWAAKLYMAQEKRREEFIDRVGVDPLKQETFRTEKSFLLTFLTQVGYDVDPIRFWEIEQGILDNFNETLFPLLTEATIYRPKTPPQPFANGAKDHTEDCFANNKSPQYDKKRATGKNKETCDCPPKMTGGKKAGIQTKILQAYVWELCRGSDDFQISFTKSANHADVGHFSKHQWASDPLVTTRLMTFVAVNKEFLEAHKQLDPIVLEYADYQEYSKLVSSYLPSLREASENGYPVRSQYSVVKSTGRTSARDASKGKTKEKFYCSWNSQQVDPRVRTICIAPKDIGFTEIGNRYECPGMDWVMASIDYSAMELGTWSQRCIDLLGFSDCATMILNQGKDAHMYLAGALATQFDPDFAAAYAGDSLMATYEFLEAIKKDTSFCDLPLFIETWKDAGRSSKPTWKDFCKHYRTFAKPVGLGYPGGLGVRTLCTMAAATYHFKVTEAESKQAREIWKSTYREAQAALTYVNNELVDPSRDIMWKEDPRTGKRKREVRYAYTTAGGLYRSNCTYTAAANGCFLQAPGAEGALAGMANTIREAYSGSGILGPDSYGLQTVPINFVHDEGIFLLRRDGNESKRAFELADLMVAGMKTATPDVTAGAEPVLMFRWDKKAEAEYDSDGVLIPWDEDDRPEREML